MRSRKPMLAAACTATLLISIPACSSHSAPSANSPLADSTRANALSAMHGEALAHAKYLAYAGSSILTGQSA